MTNSASNSHDHPRLSRRAASWKSTCSERKLDCSKSIVSSTVSCHQHVLKDPSAVTGLIEAASMLCWQTRRDGAAGSSCQRSTTAQEQKNVARKCQKFRFVAFSLNTIVQPFCLCPVV